MPGIGRIWIYAPGLALAAAIAIAASGLDQLQANAFGIVGLDALVLAILFGMVIRGVFGLSALALPGVRLAGKWMLELAILLLGASISVAEVMGLGGGLIVAVIVVVMASLGLSYGLARLLGLDERLAILVACGNSICGSSAILSCAPVVKATEGQITSAIAFTAALGVLLVLVMPLGAAVLLMDELHYGIIAGMSVYSVPQVLAATAAFGPQSAHVGTLVKLMRVLMLAPTLVVVAATRGSGLSTGLQVQQILPWFIIGFLLLLAARFFGLVPDSLLDLSWQMSKALTLWAMAALGLLTDFRDLVRNGWRLALVGTGSLVMLTGMAYLASTFF